MSKEIPTVEQWKESTGGSDILIRALLEPLDEVVTSWWNYEEDRKLEAKEFLETEKQLETDQQLEAERQRAVEKQLVEEKDPETKKKLEATKKSAEKTLLEIRREVEALKAARVLWANLDKQRQVFLLARMRYYALRFPVGFGIEAFEGPIEALTNAATWKLATMCDRIKDFSSLAKTMRIVDNWVREVLETGLTESGFATDQQTLKQSGRLPYSNTQKKNDLWKYEVHFHEGKLVQFPWWKTEGNFTEQSRLPVCTMARCDVALKVPKALKPLASSGADRLVNMDVERILSDNDLDRLKGDDVKVWLRPTDGEFTKRGDNDEYIEVYHPEDESGRKTRDFQIFIRAYVRRDGSSVIYPLYPATERSFDALEFINMMEAIGVEIIWDKQIKFDKMVAQEYLEVELRHEEIPWIIRGNGDYWAPRAWTLLNWDTIGRRQHSVGEHWGGYVLTKDGRLYMALHTPGSLFHSYYTSGGPVICAGSVMVDGEGTLMAVSNLSGHYKPAPESLVRVLEFFRSKRIDLSNVIAVSFGGDNHCLPESYHQFMARDVLRRGTLPNPKSSLTREEIIKSVGNHRVFMPHIKRYAALSSLPKMGHLGVLLADSIMLPFHSPTIIRPYDNIKVSKIDGRMLYRE